MIFERNTFRVADVVVGRQTAWHRGTLTVDVDAIGRDLRRQPGIREASVHITRPGDGTRIIDVLDVVAPSSKPGDVTFPGLLGPVGRAGQGRTDQLDGLAVISTDRLDPDPEAVPSVIDLAGPGASATPWSETFNVVLSFQHDPSVDLLTAERAIRLGTLRVARDLAAAVGGTTPDHVDRFELGEPITKLPAVCAIMAVASEGVGQDTFVYGRPFHGPPRLIGAEEVLDGAVVSGAYTQPGTRQPTYFYQRSDLLLRLMRLDGTTLHFAGVVLTQAYLDDTAEKERVALEAALLAVESGAEGAILTTYGGGNSHTDVMLVCRAIENRGLKTAILLAETNAGLTDYVSEADCIVSVGNEDELVPEWRPDRVLGGDQLPNGRSADDAGPLPYLAYLGSVTQTGDRRLRASPS